MNPFRRGRRLGPRLVLCCLLVLVVSCGVGSASAEQHGQTEGIETVVENETADPPSDRLGWENGIWANATLSIDQSDGINRTEKRALVARTMARIETVRGLEFERTPPVRVLFQRELQAEFESRSSAVATTNASRVVLNQQYEALFLIDETRDAVDSRRTLYGTGTNGLYDPETRNVTMVSPNATIRKLREGVLAQELFHAQQDNKFQLPPVETIEQRNTRNSYVEGDANYVQDLYERRCENVWEGSCYRLNRESIPDLSGLNDGMARLFQQPYQSGYRFVRDRHQRSGWEAVNELYEQPPASTEQVIHPESYRGDEPTELRIADRSTDDWQPLTADGERVTESVGESGLFVSLLYPALQTVGDRQIIPLDAHLSEERRVGSRDELGGQIYSYAHPLTAGWDGDKLLPYVSTNGTRRGYVYETVWDSPADARAFHEGYRKLLAYHEADAVPERSNTYRLPSDSGFEDAVYINRTNNRVRIVNGPSVGALQAIRRGTAPDATRLEPSLPWERVGSEWNSTVGSSLDTVAVQNGVAYTQDRTGSLYAVDGDTGKRQWTHRFNSSLVSSPAVSEELLYLGTGQQRIVAVDATTGDRDWTRRLSGPVIAAPTVIDSTVYAVTVGGELYALNRTTGQQIWTEPVENATVSKLTVNDGVVVVPRATGVSGIDTQTGAVLWEADVNSTVLPRVSLSNETAFVRSVKPAERTTVVHAVDTSTGEVAWQYPLTETARVQLTAVGHTVYANTVDAYSREAASEQQSGSVLALDGRSGQVRWRLDLSGAPKRPLVSGQTVYTGTSAGQIHAVDTVSGTNRWNYSVEQSVTEPLVIDNQTLYAGTQGGVLSALNVTDGHHRWTYFADGLRAVSPVVDSETLYVNSGSTLTALESTTGRNDPQAVPPTDPASVDSTDSAEGASEDGSSSTDETGTGFGVSVTAVGFLIVLAVGRRLQ